MADTAVISVVCLHQEGEWHYNQGNVPKAIDSFQTALEKAKSINERHLENICSYNLASVYAANGNKEEFEQILQNLPNKFIDDMLQEGGNSILYLRAVANRSLWHYEQALKVPNDFKNQTYLLEQLVKLHREKQDKCMQTKYLEQLKEAYQVQRNDMRRFKVICQLARLYIRDNRTEDAQKVLRELKKEVADYTTLATGNISLGTRSLRTEDQEMRCLVPLWNEMGLMFTFLTKYQKALECFQNGLELITNKTPASINTAVLKQNIGAVRNMKEDFELAIESHSEAIKTFVDYANAKKGSNRGGKKLPGREKLENTCTGSDEGLMYTLTIENNGRWVIYEALKDDQAACAGAARSFLNMGNAHFKLGDIMDAQDKFSQAYVCAKEAQDTRTMMQAYEAKASVAMRCRESRAAREYLVTAMEHAFSIKGWRESSQGQGQHVTYDVQRITDKLSKLPVTMSAERFQEDFNKTTGYWSPLSKSTRSKTLITSTLQAFSHHPADKGQGPSRRK